VCQICPTDTQPNAQGVCAECGLNRMIYDGRCICSTGFIPNELGICTRCTLVQGAFLVNGRCAKCPGTLQYNGQRCTCPAGSTRVGTKCFETCKDDELVDANGLCYTCPIYEVKSNGTCVCEANFARNVTNGRCELSCPTGQFAYQGRCAQCPLNLEYRLEINGCSCPDGQYLNNFGVCERVVLQPIACGDGFYFNQLTGCVACPSGCKTCSGPTTCTSCTQTGYAARNGVCQPLCGDGLIVGNEACDDGNAVSGEGCSSTCTVEVFYTCSGQPSVCVYNGPAICGNRRIESPETCDDGNTRSGDGCSSSCQIETTTPGNTTTTPNTTNPGLSLVGEVNTNIKDVFVVLKTSTTFTFANENEMESFMKTNFPGSTSVPQVYCSQRQAPELDIFDCLAIYSSGIPNQKYNIEFSYERNGIKGFLSVPVDPLSSSFATRSLRSSSRRT
jgi:cysteine-rich repeat protein